MRTPIELANVWYGELNKWSLFVDFIEEVQKEAYNQALKDITDNDLLVDKEKNLKKYLKR